jgi:diguanylate cyclase (GGDEF)-like protein
MALDPRSLLFMAAIMASFMAVVLFFMRRYFPPHIRGLGLWALAPVAWVTAATLLGLRGLIGEFASIVLGNVLTVLGSVLFYLGCRRFYGHAAGHWRWGAALLAEALLLAWMTHISPWPAGRMVVFTVMMLLVFGSNLHFMVRHGEPRFPARMVITVLALQIAVLLMRLLAALSGQASNQLLDPSLIQVVYLGSYALFVLLLSIGAVLLATDRLTRELEHLATHDALTGALNRRAILQRCAEELERSQRFGQGLALMMLDLDHFKTMNDTRGHQHGDAVLEHFVLRVQDTLRRTDHLGRYGGEEFLVLLPHTDLPSALQTAERIHAALATGHALDCQLSIGISTWAGDQDSLDTLLARADKALYLAKELGRNRTCTA